MGPTRLIVLLLSLMLGHLAYGQDITLTTQAEVDAFNPTLTSITGYLHINGNSSPDPILDLSPLTNLISIGGYLWIDDNVALTNVDGLSGVTSIGGYLRFLNNDALTNVDGLSGLTSIGEYLSFLNNDALTNVDGLSGVTSIGGYLRFLNNDALTNVDGLSGVTSIGEYLHIDDNAALTDVDGLSGLTSIGGDVLIGSNADLSDCCGIQHLLATPGAIGGFITIFNNPSECSSQEEILSSSSCGLTASIITYPPCIGTANGSMLVDVNGYDTLPIYYTWIRAEDGAMGSGTSTSDVFSIDQLIAGTYTVQVTTPRPDTTTQTNIVLDPIDGAIFEIIELTGTNSSNGLNNGSIQVVIAGGIAPYSYTWTGEAAGNQSNINSDSYTIPTLAHGEYLITVMDDVGNAQQVAMTLLDEVVPVIPCTQPLDIVILNDVSGSVDAIEYAESKQFFVDFLHAANIGQGPDESRAAIIEWSSSNDQQIQLPMTGQITELDTYTVMSRAFGGGTSPHEALRFGANYLESVVRPDAERVLILSTDGTGGQVSPSLVALADEYKAAGYHIATIAFDDAFHQILLGVSWVKLHPLIYWRQGRRPTLTWIKI